MAGNLWRLSERSLFDWRKEMEDPTTRKGAQAVAFLVTVAVILMGVTVGLVPLLFDDSSEARKVLAAVIFGSLAAIAGRAILRSMAGEATGEKAVAFEEGAQPEPVLVLAGVDLRDAALPAVDLGRSELTNALLSGVDFNAARLQASRLSGASLQGADLRQADLRLADLRDGDLRGADLRATDLRGALHANARWEGALYNEATNWPEGIPPKEAVLVTEIREPVQ